ncbi:putative E3 ubiquitin-protein ligase UNKL isoform X3 [Erinaceus europaeus]|uniref:E3 ubiquitin-protein ligase UNKL isoform X3 n=1 Tax=Erinaceus europaeus TaxID=9365 RepID=A0ABM3VWC1_ERIEU|nr:putative E3 ubiquitin-protein ligase UNKL isoform X3 [Erinaceus europaeus]XP_060028636.1 putative E3 ubiquitin-protein ligase UNKL isoform X3 [Erinaceus europaeus]
MGRTAPSPTGPWTCGHLSVTCELQAHQGQPGGREGLPELQPGVLASQATMERLLDEDPRWQEAAFVLRSYKTEPCPKPPCLCRQGYACPHFHSSRDRRRNPRTFPYRSTPCPSVKQDDEWGEPSRCESGDRCLFCHSRTEQQFHPEIYKSSQCKDVHQTGHCPRGPFCTFAHTDKSPRTASDWGCRDLPPLSSTAATNGQLGNSHLAMFTVLHPLAPSVGSSMESSLASSTGSGGSSPTVLPTLPGHAHLLNPTDGLLEPSPDKELEEQARDPGVTGQRLLGGSAPVSIPGRPPRSPSLQSSSSLSTSPLSSLSQSLSGPRTSSMTPPQQPLKPEPGALGSSASPYNSLGLNGVPGSIWDFVSGSLSPSPSPTLGVGPGASPSPSELARVRRQLDEAKRKIRQWEASWQQVKQACAAWQREAEAAKERALAADSARQLALQRKEEAEAQVLRLQGELRGRGRASLATIPLPELHCLQSQLRLNLEAVDGVIFQLCSQQCALCPERAHSGAPQSCQHRVLCEPCAAGAPECPYCAAQPPQW